MRLRPAPSRKDRERLLSGAPKVVLEDDCNDTHPPNRYHLWLLSFVGCVYSSILQPGTAMSKSRPKAVGSLIVVALSTTGTSASAQSPAPAAGMPSTTTSTVVVTARKPIPDVTVTASRPCIVRAKDVKTNVPIVIDTFPHIDSKIRPGLIYLRVTFSEPMTRCNYDLRMKDGENHPIILSAPVYLSPDRRSFLFPALVGANTRDYMWIGKPVEPANFGNFKSSGPSPLDFRSGYGVSAKSYRLRFSASKGPMVKTVADALAADPEMPKLVAQPGEFLRLRRPERDDGVDLWRCQDCDVDLRMVYAKVANVSDSDSQPSQPRQSPPAEGTQSSETSAHP